MNAPDPISLARSAWPASLDLRFARQGARTVPTLRAHRGPLRIQKGFTPEGPDLWHQVIVHPPGGIASGDSLDIRVGVEAHGRALLTSPGAAKWYRANPHAPQPLARQSLHLSVADGASLEWLPLETIVFDGAQAQWQSRFELTGSAVLVAAELVCLGRPASSLGFDSGELRWNIELVRDDRLLFCEQAVLSGGSAALRARSGLAGLSAFGSLLLAADEPRIGPLIERVRELEADFPGDWAITALPGLALLRWRGDGAEVGWRVLRAAWKACRPLLLSRPACEPRIWAT